MSRIVKDVEIGGERLKALFDSDAPRSYITEAFRPSSSRSVSPISVG